MTGNKAPFNDGDRVTHPVKGLGTIRHDPQSTDEDALLGNEDERVYSDKPTGI